MDSQAVRKENKKIGKQESVKGLKICRQLI